MMDSVGTDWTARYASLESSIPSSHDMVLLAFDGSCGGSKGGEDE